MPALIHFSLPPDVGGKGGEVRAILEAHVAREHSRTARSFLVHVLAVVGGLLVLSTTFPHVASEEAQTGLLILWGVCCVWVAVAATSEWVYHRREVRLLAANRGAVGD